MTYSIAYLPSAARDIKKLDRSVFPQVKKAIERLAEEPELGKPLMYSLSGYRSYRTSSYRIIYKVKDEEVVILVVAVGHRREVYDKLRKLLGG